jgi:hypothetical protein
VLGEFPAWRQLLGCLADAQLCRTKPPFRRTRAADPLAGRRGGVDAGRENLNAPLFRTWFFGPEGRADSAPHADQARAENPGQVQGRRVGAAAEPEGEQPGVRDFLEQSPLFAFVFEHNVLPFLDD